VTERWVFATWPYLAVACLLLVPAGRALVARHPCRDVYAHLHRQAPRFWGATLWRWSLATVIAGHVLILVLPDVVLAWNRSPERLLALEAVLFASGSAALVGLLAILSRRVTVSRGPLASLLDSIVLSLFTLTMISGLLLGVFHRWASSWSAVTLAPYFSSLAAFEPDASLVADMPFLVRFHLVTAFALMTLIPLRLPLLVGIVRPFSARRVMEPDSVTR
jgi:nitrate reductase gamma subunit